MTFAVIQLMMLVTASCWLGARCRRHQRLARLERSFADAVATGSYRAAELHASAWFAAARGRPGGQPPPPQSAARGPREPA